MKRTSSTSRLGLGTWRATLVALGAATALGGCGGGEPPAGGSGVAQQALQNAAGAYVATAETTASGAKLNGTTFVHTQADDGTPEQLAEGGAVSAKRLTHTWTIGSVSGTGFTLTVKAKKLEGSGDSFSFGWATVAAGPFTAFCTVGTADTSYKTCTQAVTVAAGTTALYVRVTDSILSGDSTVNTLHVDYVAAVASGAGGDTTAPTDGATFTATGGSAQVSLAWSAASDNVGVASYKLVYAAGATAPATCAVGTPIGGTLTGLTYVHTGLAAATTYSYRVCALDAAGNVSVGKTASATTAAAAAQCTSGDCCDTGTQTYKAAGTVCRAAADVCDAAEVCDGASAACPADLKAAAGTVCRPAAGACDVAEACTGASAACPADLKVAAGTVCRPVTGFCDVAEACTGASAACPTDLFVAGGTACNDGLYCTVADACNGAGACVGAARDCSALGDGTCYVGACNEYLAQCEPTLDPAGDGNACTTDDTCASATGTWSATTNICGGPGAFTATPTADGIRLTWTNPPDAGLTAVELYRTLQGETITRPEASAARIYAGLGTTYLDGTAPAGEVMVYTAFARYSAAGWSAPRTASARRDDADGDGMADAWEVTNGLDPYNPGDASLDPDGDGLSNLMEYLYGTNRLVADTDGDGIVDGQEVALGLDPTVQDTDGDGMADGFEVGMGLDPLNGHDFAIGNFLFSENYRVGAFVVDSGQYKAGGWTSQNNQLVIASQQQSTPIGVMGSPAGFGWGGYLYTIEEYIAPNYPPQGDAGPDQTVNLPATVQLGGSASDPNGDPVSFSWTFVSVPALSAVTNASLGGATTPTPSFTPDVYGYYMLQLAVTDVLGVSGAPSYVIVTAVNDGQFYTTGPFTSVSETNKLVAGTTSVGGTLPFGMASGLNQVGSVVGDRGPSSATALASESYRVQGRLPGTGEFAHGAAGFLGTAFALYDVTTNVAPLADAGPDQTVPFGTTVVLDGSASADPDSFPAALTYQWSIWQRPYQSAAVIAGATASVASFTPDRAGSYVILLRVYDGEIWSVPDPIVVTVANTPPVAVAGPDQHVKLISPAPAVALDGSGSHDPEGQPITYAWRFFRKPDGSTAALSAANVASPTFVPDKIGYYRLELVVKDAILVSAPAYVTVSVGTTSGNLPPVAAVGPRQALVAVNSTGLDGSGSADPDWDTVAWPDPDANGVYRKGLAYDWSFISKPAGSTAFIACATPETPAWDCPNPKLSFNGFNGDYLIGLKVVDAALAVSDQVTVAVTVSGIQNVAPVAVVSPKVRVANFADLAQRISYLDGSRSYDPVVAGETLTYSWTLVQRPVGSTAALQNAATAAPSFTMDKIGQYKVHLKVCDATAKCSCAWGESRPGDAYCNQESVATVTTITDSLRVAMPADWPAVGSQGGSGGNLTLLTSDDGVYDKPIIMTVGFTGFFAAFNGGASDGAFGPFKSLVGILRARGYDVWWLTNDPVCSGGAVPNLNANWGTGGQDFCAAQGCACPWPQQPVDNHVSLNAVVLAQAIQMAKNYGACGAKSPDDPTDPCFVRVFGPSMGGVIGRFALAWAQDGTKVTVPYASRETSPYAMNGMRAKPEGQDVWDLGARVFLSGDAPHQGANVPVSLQAMVKAFEANTPDSTKSGGMMSGFGFQTSGVGNIIAWAFLKHRGLRDWAIDHRDLLEPIEGMISGGMTAWTLVSQVLAYQGLGTLVPALSAVVGAVSGFLEGMVAGWQWAVLGAVINGAVQYALTQLYIYLINAFGVYGLIASVVIAVLDYFFGVGSLLFSVKTSSSMTTLPDSTVEFSPFNLTPTLDSPAAQELLEQSVTGYRSCPDVPSLLQGTSVPNRWPAGFGKEANGRVCRGTADITATSAMHDQFYAFLGSLNGGRGYPTNVRNVGLAFGGAEPGIAADNGTLFEMYLPYVVANQAYPTWPTDHLAGSGFGPEVQDMMARFRLHLRGTLTITKKVLFWSSSSTKLLFDDVARFPAPALVAGMNWPFIPTQSAMDFTRPAGCGVNLPCCQILPRGVVPHPQEDSAQNCCRCTTRLDAVFMPGQSLLHVPALIVNPCRRGTNDDAFLERLRQECVAADQTKEVEGVQRKMCPGDETVYLYEGASGYLCGPDANEAATREAIALLTKGLAQLDTRPTCAAAQATFVCLSGLASCAAAEGTWFWVGGHDRDGDGCPGRTLPSGEVCGTYCETDAEDLDPTVVGNVPQGNAPPVIAAVSAQRSFALPTCYANQETHTYACQAAVTDAQQTPLTVSVTASDANGDPLTYRWEFLPDASQGQSAADVALLDGLSAATRVVVSSYNKPPQGTYQLRVHVRDNKGGAVFAETAVVVPGDAPPQVTASAPAGVREICEYEADPDNQDAWRCYAALEIQASASDPDGPDQTSIILVRWEDLTDREASAYRAVTLVDDPYLLNAGLEVYISEAHAATPAGYPLRFRVTAVDVRGQQASAEVSVPVCLDSAPTCP